MINNLWLVQTSSFVTNYVNKTIEVFGNLKFS